MLPLLLMLLLLLGHSPLSIPPSVRLANILNNHLPPIPRPKLRPQRPPKHLKQHLKAYLRYRRIVSPFTKLIPNKRICRTNPLAIPPP